MAITIDRVFILKVDGKEINPVRDIDENGKVVFDEISCRVRVMNLQIQYEDKLPEMEVKMNNISENGVYQEIQNFVKQHKNLAFDEFFKAAEHEANYTILQPKLTPAKQLNDLVYNNYVSKSFPNLFLPLVTVTDEANKSYSELNPSMFDTLCTKNQALKLYLYKVDKSMVLIDEIPNERVELVEVGILKTEDKSVYYFDLELEKMFLKQKLQPAEYLSVLQDNPEIYAEMRSGEKEYNIKKYNSFATFVIAFYLFILGPITVYYLTKSVFDGAGDWKNVIKFGVILFLCVVTGGIISLLGDRISLTNNINERLNKIRNLASSSFYQLSYTIIKFVIFFIVIPFVYLAFIKR
jgi:hypothetical protein